MKKIFSTVLACLVLGGASAYAEANYNPCNPCENPNVFLGDAYGEFLWWNACRTDIVYQQSEGPKHFNPGYNAGWRVGANVSRNCWDVGGRYTHYNNNETLNLAPVFAQTGAFLKYEVDYHVGDIEFGVRHTFCCNAATLRPFAGARLAWIDEKRFFSVGGAVPETNIEHLSFEGYGIYMGAEGIYDLYTIHFCNSCIPITFIGRGSVGILQAQVKEKQFIEAQNFQAFRDQDCFYSTVIDVMVALRLGGIRIKCVDTYIQVGYEVQNWQVLGFLTDAVELNQSTTNLEDLKQLGFGGLTLRLGAGF